MPNLGDFTEFDRAAEQAEQDEPDTFIFYGETFTVAGSVSVVPMMKFAKASTINATTPAQEVALLVTLHDFLTQALVPGDFDRLTRITMERGSDDEVLYDIAARVYAVIGARPTKRPSSSLDGRPSTSPNSKPTSHSQALANAGLTAEDMASPEEALSLLRSVG